MISIRLNPHHPYFFKVSYNPSFMPNMVMRMTAVQNDECETLPIQVTEHFIQFETQEEADQFKADYPQLCLDLGQQQWTEIRR